MDGIERNNIAMAVLGTLLAVFGLGTLSDTIYHVDKPEKQGFAIEVAEAAPGGEEAGGGTAAPVPLVDLLKLANAEKGAGVAKKCATCHDFSKGGPNKTGPNLWDVVERPVGAHGAFKYSPAMTAKAAEIKTWTYENLNAFLVKPSAYVPKTGMIFGGLKDKERADMLAYLQSLSDAPKPFPAQ